jgi:hypothetical protein
MMGEHELRTRGLDEALATGSVRNWKVAPLLATYSMYQCYLLIAPFLIIAAPYLASLTLP